MKITDVTVTLFKWENIPLKSYDHAVKSVAGTSDLGLVRIKQMKESKAMHYWVCVFTQPASKQFYIIRFLKPILMARTHWIASVYFRACLACGPRSARWRSALSTLPCGTSRAKSAGCLYMP